MIAKFDIVKFEYSSGRWGAVAQDTVRSQEIGIVVAYHRKDETFRIVGLSNNYRRVGGCFTKESITEVLSSGLEEALKRTKEAEDEQMYNWVKGNKLQKLVRQHKKKKKLLIVTFKETRNNHQTKTQVVTEHEHVIDDVKLSTRRWGVSIISAPLSGEQNTYIEPFISSLDFERDLRVADPTELLTSDNAVGRMFAVHPILEWLPKIEKKFERNKKVAEEDSRRLKWDVKQLFAQKNVFPTAVPRRVRTLAVKILEEQTSKSDLPARLELLLEELQQLYDKTHLELSAQLRAYAAEDKSN